MDDVRPIRSLSPEGEVRFSPDCGTTRGFHVTILSGDANGRPAVPCCSECGARYDIGRGVRL